MASRYFSGVHSRRDEDYRLFGFVGAGLRFGEETFNMWLPLEEQVSIGSKREEVDAAAFESVSEKLSSEVDLRVVAETSLELVEVGLAIGIAMWLTVGEVSPAKVAL